MSAPTTRRVLIVANRTESTPRLLEEVERRARSGCDFTVMVPPERHPDAPDWTAEDALELVRRAAHGRPVVYVDGGADAAAKIGELVSRERSMRSSSARRVSITSTGTATACRSASARWTSR